MISDWLIDWTHSLPDSDEKKVDLSLEEWLDGILKTVENSIRQEKDRESRGDDFDDGGGDNDDGGFCHNDISMILILMILFNSNDINNNKLYYYN